jgi:hypothetical protein
VSDGTYAIQAHRFDEREPNYSGGEHMAGKVWADLPDFAEALRGARRMRRGRA